MKSKKEVHSQLTGLRTIACVASKLWHFEDTWFVPDRVLACVCVLPVLALRPEQVLFCHQDQLAAASPSISVAARGDTPSAKWISLIGWLIYWCFPLLGIIGVWVADWWATCLPTQRRSVSRSGLLWAELTYISPRLDIKYAHLTGPFIDYVKACYMSERRLRAFRCQK